MIRTLSSTPPVPGHDVRLTLDMGVQQIAETALDQGLEAARHAKDTSYKKGFRTLAAPAGAVVVLDATTGSVVAMASNPTYDPNQFVHGIPEATWKQWQDKASGFPLLNRAVSGQYAPGSTFKLMTAIAGLTSGDITADQDDQRHRLVRVPDATRTTRSRARARRGRVDLNRALAVSSDVYFYTVGGDLYYRWKHQQPGGDALQATAARGASARRPASRCPNEAIGPDPGRGVEAADPRRTNPAAFPYPDWLPGRQHPHRRSARATSS